MAALDFFIAKYLLSLLTAGLFFRQKPTAFEIIAQKVWM
jgi:hypothetical protein